MKSYLIIFLTILAYGCSGELNHSNSNSNINTNKPSVTSSGLTTYSYEIINTFKHDSKAFTEGLFFHNGFLYESTGLYGSSDLRKVDIESGKTLQKVNLPSNSFGEGITLFNDKIYQLTYEENICRVFDANTFQKIKEFKYTGEGWGLTHDDKNLIMSDGTHIIRYINPETFQTERTITVFDENGKPLMNINELELIKGELWANIWHSENIGKPNHIARIEPITGKLLGWINLDGISPEDTEGQPENTLNGIAFDKEDERLFVTGKNWKRLFEIKIKSN
jgi:glutamine cyclotransferase